MVLWRSNHVQSGYHAEQNLYGLPLLPHLRHFFQKVSPGLSYHQWIHNRIRTGLHPWNDLSMPTNSSLLGQDYSRRKMLQEQAMVDIVLSGTNFD